MLGHHPGSSRGTGEQRIVDVFDIDALQRGAELVGSFANLARGEWTRRQILVVNVGLLLGQLGMLLLLLGKAKLVVLGLLLTLTA